MTGGKRRGVRRRSPAVLLTGIAVVAGFVLVTGVTAALTVPAVAITAQESLQSILPANTAMYVTADLNPGQGVQAELSAFASQVTARGNWAGLLKPLIDATSSSRNRGCLRATVNKATGNLFDLGHATAFALIPAPAGSPPAGRRRHHSTLSRDFALNFVIVAPLDVHMTLLDALGGVSFTLPKHPIKHRGTSIYREVVPACDRAGGQVSAAYYAAIFKGYIVLGLRPATVEEIIDTGLGRRQALTSVRPAVETISSLPSNVTGGFFINPRSLAGSPVLVRRLEAWKIAPRALFRWTARWGKVVAGAVSVQSGGIHVTIAFARRAGNPGASSMTLNDPTTPLFQVGQSQSVVEMKGNTWAAKWLERVGILTLPRGRFIWMARHLGLHAAVVEPTASSSPHSAAGPDRVLFLGRAWSAQGVRDAVAGIGGPLAGNTTNLWPQSNLLGAISGTSPRPGAWTLISPPMGRADAGYEALWQLNIDRQPSFVKQLLGFLPFPLDGRLGQVARLSKKSFHTVSGSLFGDPVSGIDTVTLNLATFEPAAATGGQS